MRGAWMIGAAAAALAGGGVQAAELVLDDVVARVVVTPEARADIQVQVQPGRAPLPLRVDRSGATVRVSGGYDVNRCSGRGDAMRVRVRGHGEFAMADAPLITVRAPRSVTVRKDGGAVVGSVGPTQDLTLSAGGCSRFTLGDVAGTLTLDQSGGASASVNRARIARLRASGGGSIELQSTASLDADASGGGVVRVASVTGPVSAEGSGGGGVKVAGGRTGLLRADASGGGWVDFDGVADALDANASGGGRVSVARVTGRVDRSSSGGGSISVGR